MRGLKRYRLIALWMVFVFAMGFIVFNYSMQSKVNSIYEKKDIENNSYKYSCTLSVFVNPEGYDSETNYKNSLIKALNEMDDSNITISIIDLTTFEGKSGIGFLTDLYIDGEVPKYELINGAYPTKEQLSTSNRYAVLGKNRINYTYSVDGRDYIILDGLEYEVTGCMSTGQSSYLDNDVLIFDRNYGDSLWNNINDYIIMGMVSVVFESDENSLLLTYADTFGQLLSDVSGKRMCSEIVSINENMRFSPSQVPEPRYRRWAWVAYIFCLVTIFFIIQYWLMQRKKEFAIKKISGYTTLEIVLQFLLEASVIMLIGIVCGEIGIIALDSLNVGFIVFNAAMVKYLMLIVAEYIVITLIVIAIYPSIWLMCMKPVSVMNKKKGS